MIFEEGIQDNVLSNEMVQNSEELTKLRGLIADFLSNKKIVPPLQQQEVLKYSSEFVSKYQEFKKYQKLVAVLVNNNAWQPVIEKIPFHKRILLLPKCLRHATNCPAKTDELGLICEQCGKCTIDHILTQADKLGYYSVVSEGTGAVSMLLTSGQVECVIGVGCLDSFERSFPLAVKEAIPSMAIPLFNSDCINSTTDNEWVFETLNLKNGAFVESQNLDTISADIERWFSKEKLTSLFGEKYETEKIANKWLEAGGKRWRPLILTSIYKALNINDNLDNEALMKLAISVECFHKASLVHDDIADNDSERYNKPALHEEFNVPVALNVGDLLIGYGYQLIASSGLSSEIIHKLIQVASKGHRDLCIGQGQELLLQNRSRTLSVNETIEIFRYKTAPAFEVALKFGAILGNANDELIEILGNFSEILGIAYQIQDDLGDFNQDSSINDIEAFRLSLILSILGDKYPEKMEQFIMAYQNTEKNISEEIFAWAREEGAQDQAMELLKEYKQKAINILSDISNPHIKILLYRLVNRILRDV